MANNHKVCEYGGMKFIHNSTSSSVKIVKTYKQEVEQGVCEDVTTEECYDYSEINDLYNLLNKASETLGWLLDKKDRLIPTGKGTGEIIPGIKFVSVPYEEFFNLKKPEDIKNDIDSAIEFFGTPKSIKDGK